jgi:hypothetical protein
MTPQIFVYAAAAAAAATKRIAFVPDFEIFEL